MAFLRPAQDGLRNAIFTGHDRCSPSLWLLADGGQGDCHCTRSTCAISKVESLWSRAIALTLCMQLLFQLTHMPSWPYILIIRLWVMNNSHCALSRSCLTTNFTSSMSTNTQNSCLLLVLINTMSCCPFFSIQFNLALASSPASPIFSTHARKEAEPGIQNHVTDVCPYIYRGRKRGGSWKLRVGEDDFWAIWLNASEKEGYTSISEGRTILIRLGEPCFIDQRCQIGLKSMLCGDRCITPFYQRLSRDFRYQAPPLFSRIEETGDEANLAQHWRCNNVFHPLEKVKQVFVLPYLLVLSS